MPVKMVVYINQANRGFSETYYLAGDVGTYTSSTLAISEYLRARVALLETPASIVAIRWSSITLPLRSSLENLKGAYVAGKKGSVAPILGAPDPVTTDAVILLTDFAGVKRRLFLRGLPDSSVERDGFGNDTPPPSFTVPLARLIEALVAGNFLVRVQQKPPTVGFTQNSIIKVAADPVNPHQAIVTCRANPNFVLANQPQVRFGRIDTDNLPGFPRIATVVDQSVAAPFSITIPYRVRAAGVVTPPNMYFIPLGYSYLNFTQGRFERYSEHKTGRPFGSLRGRTRALVRAQ